MAGLQRSDWLQVPASLVLDLGPPDIYIVRAARAEPLRWVTLGSVTLAITSFTLPAVDAHDDLGFLFVLICYGVWRWSARVPDQRIDWSTYGGWPALSQPCASALSGSEWQAFNAVTGYRYQPALYSISDHPTSTSLERHAQSHCGGSHWVA